jgi:pimeloyl-ACP methyl ester carboxylesterase
VQPIYFGKSGSQLFGVYHPPLARRAAEAAVLLCYPLVQEYMRTHWAMRKLATGLAREGVHALRFDYFGTGDSAGEVEGASLPRWLADVRAAAAELKDLAGVRRVSIVGLRLGAGFAAMASAGGLEVKDLVLWEPATEGAGHLRELQAVEGVKYGNSPNPPVSGPEELLNYPLPEPLRKAIEAIDLRTISRCAADRILLFSEADRAEHQALCGALRDRSGRPPERHVVAEEARDRHEGVLLSSRVLQAIIAGLAGGVA